MSKRDQEGSMKHQRQHVLPYKGLTVLELGLNTLERRIKEGRPQEDLLPAIENMKSKIGECKTLDVFLDDFDARERLIIVNKLKDRYCLGQFFGGEGCGRVLHSGYDICHCENNL